MARGMGRGSVMGTLMKKVTFFVSVCLTEVGPEIRAFKNTSNTVAMYLLFGLMRHCMRGRQ